MLARIGPRAIRSTHGCRTNVAVGWHILREDPPRLTSGLQLVGDVPGWKGDSLVALDTL